MVTDVHSLASAKEQAARAAGSCSIVNDAYRADTISASEETPTEVGSTLDASRLVVWIAAVENGRFVNRRDGSVLLGDGTHVLRLYVPNVGSIDEGTRLRLFVRTPDGNAVGGPTIVY